MDKRDRQRDRQTNRRMHTRTHARMHTLSKCCNPYCARALRGLITIKGAMVTVPALIITVLYCTMYTVLYCTTLYYTVLY